MGLKRQLKKIIYPNKYSSEAYVNYLRSIGCKVGENTYFYDPKSTSIDSSRPEFIEIGSKCHITQGVTILAHDYSYAVLRDVYDEVLPSSEKTKIGNNVFIGMKATLLMGARVEDNVIIGAGSVVTGIVRSGTIVAGNPAKEISTIDKYYDKLKKSVVENAKFHARHIIQTKKRNPTIGEMGYYAWIFLIKNEENYNKYFKKLPFRGDNKEEALINFMKLENKYTSFKEFLNDL